MLVRKGGLSRNIHPARLAEYAARGYRAAGEAGRAETEGTGRAETEAQPAGTGRAGKARTPAAGKEARTRAGKTASLGRAGG